MKSRIFLAVADPARGCVSNNCKLDLVDIYGGLLHRSILITSLSFMLTHTLIIMYWQIKVSSCRMVPQPMQQDTRVVSCQCGDWWPLVANKGPGYLYHWEHMVVYIQTHQWNESITLKYRWASCSSAQRMTERHTSAHPTVSDQRCTPIRTIVEAPDGHINYW